jgi:ketosteroid isomerase-like protein
MTPEEASIVIHALGNAFGAGDVERVVDLFADGDVIYAGSERGEVAVGRAQLRLLLADLFARDERYSWRVEQVHVVACRAGWLVLAEATLSVESLSPEEGHSEPETSPCRISGLLEEIAGDWRWRFCHTSEPIPS